MAAWLSGPGRTVFFVLALVGLFCVGISLAWLKLKTRILDSPEYRVGPEQVEITPLPGWIHSDVRGEVFRNPTLDGPLPIMDDDLCRRVFEAFSSHPWIARVRRVSKQHPNPAVLRVELEYRKPVCMVDVPGGCFAVDVEGVVLPGEDFSPVEATTRYLHLLGVDRRPSGPPGKRWIDNKVTGGAEIAAALEPVWEIMGIKCIVPLPADPVTGLAGKEPFYLLETQRGSKILWGYAPGAKIPGEIPADKKVALLQKYHAEHDSLDAPQDRPQELDIRTLGKVSR